jgi:hypothetical protein
VAVYDELSILHAMLLPMDPNVAVNLRWSEDAGYLFWDERYPLVRITLRRLKQLIASTRAYIPIVDFCLSAVDRMMLQANYDLIAARNRSALRQQCDRAVRDMCIALGSLHPDGWLLVTGIHKRAFGNIVTTCCSNVLNVTATPQFIAGVNDMNVFGSMWVLDTKKMLFFWDSSQHQNLLQLDKLLPLSELRTRLLTARESAELAGALDMTFVSCMMEQQYTAKDIVGHFDMITSYLCATADCSSLTRLLQTSEQEEEYTSAVRARNHGLPLAVDHDEQDRVLARFVHVREDPLAYPFPALVLLAANDDAQEQFLTLRIEDFWRRRLVEDNWSAFHIPGYSGYRYNEEKHEIELAYTDISDVRIEYLPAR